MSEETTAPDPSEYSAWQTIGEAAAARRVSERTLRKRIKAGEVEAVKTAITGGGVAWRVAAETEANRKRTGSGTEASRKTAPEARRKSFERETAPERKRVGSESETGTENAPEVSEPRPAPETEATARADLLAQLRTENEYLKEQVNAWRLQTEAANRTASETAAALREILKTMPRAIEAPANAQSESTATGSSTPTREDAPQRAETIEVAQPARSTPNASQRKPQREPRPLWKVILGIR